MAAEAARHEEVAIDAAAMLGSAYADLTHDMRAARPVGAAGGGDLGALHRPSAAARARRRVSTPWSCAKEGRFAEALAEEQRVLAIRMAELGPSSVDVAMSNNNLAGILHELGRDQEALVHIRRAIDIFAKVLGEDNGRIALASVNECEILTVARSLRRSGEDDPRARSTSGRARAASSFYVGAALAGPGKAQARARRRTCRGRLASSVR